MPELPEAETLIQSMKAVEIENQTIKETQIYYDKVLTSSEFNISSLKELKILNIFRKGKQIVFSLSDNFYLIAHLKMTGHFFLAVNKYQRASLKLENGLLLSFCDIRKFGRLCLTKNLERQFANLGQDPFDLDFDMQNFYYKISRSSKKIKPLLLDQSIVSGIGNIYADEALWEAKLNPERTGRSLTKKQALSLFNAVKKVLIQGIKNKGTSLGKTSSNFSDINNNFGKNQNFLKAYSRSGLPCSRCGFLIIRKKINGRSSSFCPNCQKF